MAKLGGIQDKGNENDLHIESLARFAVGEHNKKENAVLQFVKVVKVKEQVVAGTVYYITLEVLDGDKKKLYEAKVWEKAWLNFKEVQEFHPVVDDSAQSSAN
ncbi:Cysteine proteinase inhibitor 1 [Morus notabilis]|uniref:Cysteine proteinase inhibitor n=1 Tax=Morus notabilis TaxID=981085 RepID=W9RU19_9ROSA|nr:cysteine proteinase inhibitor 1 [Morus notabilis]EXC10036.1 Cysteine proteinase inhibitor 1 [Morus notabilis]